jgi:intracellular sulfur oxidation DsrE/DsrF family protein
MRCKKLAQVKIRCSVAMRLTHITADHIVPEVQVVGNGWISLMAYQARGYAYIQP